MFTSPAFTSEHDYFTESSYDAGRPSGPHQHSQRDNSCSSEKYDGSNSIRWPPRNVGGRTQPQIATMCLKNRLRSPVKEAAPKHKQKRATPQLDARLWSGSPGGLRSQKYLRRRGWPSFPCDSNTQCDNAHPLSCVSCKAWEELLAIFRLSWNNKSTTGRAASITLVITEFCCHCDVFLWVFRITNMIGIFLVGKYGLNNDITASLQNIYAKVLTLRISECDHVGK